MSSPEADDDYTTGGRHDDYTRDVRENIAFLKMITQRSTATAVTITDNAKVQPVIGRGREVTRNDLPANATGSGEPSGTETGVGLSDGGSGVFSD